MPQQTPYEHLQNYVTNRLPEQMSGVFNKDSDDPDFARDSTGPDRLPTEPPFG